MGVAFAFGALYGRGAPALLGQHALVYTVLSDSAIMMHRRLVQQTQRRRCRFPLFAFRRMASKWCFAACWWHVPGFWVLLAPVLEGLMAAGQLDAAGPAPPRIATRTAPVTMASAGQPRLPCPGLCTGAAPVALAA